MHKLSRLVRFSINPFLPADNNGFNSFASRPAGEGLAIYLELCVELAGEVHPATGFVVNVTDIDKNVREHVVPVFAEQIRGHYQQNKHIGFCEIEQLLKLAREQLADRFGVARLSYLSLKLNPFRKVAVDCEVAPDGRNMIYFSEKFEFAATHKLWNNEFSQQRNFEIFGKCANPAGHGHNYVLEVTIKRPSDKNDFRVGDFEKVVDDDFIKLVDHKNLNEDVEHFGSVNPTVENLAAFAWNMLDGKFGDAALHCVTVWETDKTYCSYYG